MAIFVGYAFRDEYINTILSALPPGTPKVVINKDNGFTEVSFLAGCTQFSDGLTGESAESCLRNLSPQFHFDQGNVEHEHGNYQDAVEAYSKAIQLDPQFANAYYTRGNAKRELGDTVGAIADYERAIEHNPQFAAAYYNRGTAKSGSGDMEGAKDDLVKATQIDPSLHGTEPARIWEGGTAELIP